VRDGAGQVEGAAQRGPAGRRSQVNHSVLRMPCSRRSVASRFTDGRWWTVRRSAYVSHQPLAARSTASSSSSPPSHSRGWKPPAARKASVRSTVAAAGKEPSAGPGSRLGPGTGEWRSSSTMGPRCRRVRRRCGR
jgi:hypothetical protein